MNSRVARRDTVGGARAKARPMPLDLDLDHDQGSARRVGDTGSQPAVQNTHRQMEQQVENARFCPKV